MNDGQCINKGRLEQISCRSCSEGETKWKVIDSNYIDQSNYSNETLIQICEVKSPCTATPTILPKHPAMHVFHLFIIENLF